MNQQKADKILGEIAEILRPEFTGHEFNQEAGYDVMVRIGKVINALIREDDEIPEHMHHTGLGSVLRGKKKETP